MYYYAEINSDYQVIAKHSLSEASSNPNYIQITEDLYTNGNELGDVVGQFYNTLTGVIEIVDPDWDMGQTCWMRYKSTQMRLSTKLDNMDKATLDKADADHTHSEYATANHTHSDYATADHTHSNYSLSTHTHTASEVGAATSDHNHDSAYSAINHDHDDDYAAANHSHSNYSLSTHTHTASEVGAATSGHTHSNYASTTHNHDSVYSAIGHDHDDDYAAANHTHSNYVTITALNELVTTVSGKANASHSHNDVYYTETEVDTKLSAKANTSHSHNDVYYTETEVDTKLSAKADASHTHTGVYDVNGAAADALISANAYTDSKINALVGEGASTTLDTIGEIASAIEDNQDAIDLLNSAIGTKASTLDLNSHASDAEIHITATERSNWNAKSNFSGSYNDLTNKPTIPSISGLATETYVNEAVSAKANATHTHAISDVTNLQSTLNGKANSTHTHTISDVTNLQSTLDGKAATSHGTHVSYSTTAPVMDGTASVGSASTVARSDHKHPTDTSRASQTDLSSHTSNTSNPHGVTKSQVGLGSVPNVATNDQTPTYSDTTTLATLTSGEKLSAAFAKIKLAITNLISHIANKSNPHSVTKSQVGLGNVDNTSDANKPISTATQTALNGKAATSHKHYSTAINYTGEDLNNYTDAGTYTFTNGAAVSNAPAGTNGWLVVMPWEEGSATIKQLWFRHGTVGSNDFETYVRTKIGSNSWGSWSKYYTTSNPPTFSEVGASPAFTASNGGVILSYTTADGINLLDKIEALSVGVYTIYSQAAVTGNPNTTEAWRFFVHKTNGAYGWVQGYGSYGSVYTNYLNGSGGWKGWKCIWDASPAPLWTGAVYMTSTNSTPQVVTPSKKLSECQHGWLLLWSDYDPGDGANDIDFVTTMIPKRNATGGTWGGKAFLCDIPRYIGSDTTDTSTEKRIMKVVYVHDDCIKGSYQNASGDRNDVVLRAVYEF